MPWVRKVLLVLLVGFLPFSLIQRFFTSPAG